ncbi:hypothetical protein [Hydrogenophaga sp.]|uniref:hypothetical protein n=1 Tax=Hydrogenophaga sp. TaxID=1904254 RepID=UPI002721A237|nr:hypothetical protein [Hydrogenophaga sp.]MDO9434328.1 hypothetical protein [Hydrogenophaga sp.]
MKRTAGSDFSTQPPTTLAGRREAPQGQPAPTAPDDTNPPPAWRCLADPVIGHENQSLDAVLLLMKKIAGVARQCGMQAESDEALDLLIALNRGDPNDEMTTVDLKICREATDILFRLGQHRLVCELARLHPSFPFVFELNASERQAAVLASMAASWPQEVAATVLLNVWLASDALLGLQAFVQKPLTLSLHLRAGVGAANANAEALASIVKQRPLEALTLEIGLFSASVLQALRGVLAKSICIHPFETSGGDGDVLLATFKEACVAELERAAIELVRDAGAQVLKVPSRHKAEMFFARLLAVRSHWDMVEFDEHFSSSIRDWSIADAITIGRLKLIGNCYNHDIADVADILGWAEKRGVHSIDIHGNVTLCLVVGALEAHARVSNHAFERIAATLYEGEDERDTVEEAFTLMQTNPVVRLLEHIPGSGPYVYPFSGALMARLDGMNTLNRLTSPADRIARYQRAVEQRWIDISERIGGYLLRDDHHDARLIRYLKETASALIPKRADQEAGPSFVWHLEGKLQVLQSWPVDPWLIKGAVAHCVSMNRSMGPRMCQALMRTGFARREPSPATWDRLGTLFSQTWLSESGGMKDVLGQVAPPAPSDPLVPLPVSPTTGAAVARRAAARTALAQLPPRVNPLSLVVPGDAQTLAALVHDFVVARDFFNAPANFRQGTLSAIDLVLTLLEDGTFDPARARNLAVSAELASMLQFRGQGKMLKHLVDHTPAPCLWPVEVDTDTAIASLNDLMPWPQRGGGKCALTVWWNTPSHDGTKIVAFAGTVPSHRLQLAVEPRQYLDPTIVTKIIAAHPGMHLKLLGGYGDVNVASTVDLLHAVRLTALKSLVFENIDSSDEALIQAAAALVKTSGVKVLSVHNCTPAFTHALLSCRDWASLSLTVHTGLSQPFEEGKVSAEKLTVRCIESVNVPMLNGDKFEREYEAMVVHCRDLKVLDFPDAPIDVVSLSRCLKGDRLLPCRLQSVAAALWMDLPEETIEAIRLLRQNTSLVQIFIREMPIRKELRLPPEFLHELFKLATRNRLRHPMLSAIGAGKGFGHSFEIAAMTEIGEIIGRYLSPRDVAALSFTSKAAYIGARLPWEVEIDRLARLLTLADPADFKAKLVLQLGSLTMAFKTLSGAAPPASMLVNTLAEKVAFMQAMSVPDGAIGQALGRALIAALKTDRASARAYMEAMVSVAAPSVPAQTWLREVMDIEVKPRAVAQDLAHELPNDLPDDLPNDLVQG